MFSVNNRPTPSMLSSESVTFQAAPVFYHRGVENKPFQIFAKKVATQLLKDFPRPNYFSESGTFEVYEPAPTDQQAKLVATKTFCFLHNTHFGWCTVWIEDKSSSVVRCEIQLAGFKPIRFAFPEGLVWADKHMRTWETEVLQKKRRGFELLRPVDDFLGRGAKALSARMKEFLDVVALESTKTSSFFELATAVGTRLSEPEKVQMFVKQPTVDIEKVTRTLFGPYHDMTEKTESVETQVVDLYHKAVAEAFSKKYPEAAAMLDKM
jgi:hypothetical protein